MEIVFIKDFNGIKKGTRCDISDHYGNEHIKAGNAVLSANWHGDDADKTEINETDNVSRKTFTKRTKKKHK